MNLPENILLAVMILTPGYSEAESKFTHLKETNEYIITTELPCKDNFDVLSKRAYRINNATLDVVYGCWRSDTSQYELEFPFGESVMITFPISKNQFYPVKGN